MPTLHRYILREMLATVLVAVVVCTGLLLLGNLLKEVLSLLMSGQATLGLVARGVLLLIPFILAFALPMGALTAALLVFGRMSADQELTAARANGISLMALAFPVVTASLALCGICAYINLELAPTCRVAYKALFERLTRETARTLIPAGRFVTQFPGFVIYAERIDGDEIEDVLFFQIKDGRKVFDVRAPRARIEHLTEERRIRLTFLQGRALQWVARDSMSAGLVTEAPASDTPTPGTPPSDTPPADVPASDPPTGETPTNEAPTVEVGGTPAIPAIPATPATTTSESTNRSPATSAPPIGGGMWQDVNVEEIPFEVALPREVTTGGLPQLGDMTFRQLRAERAELLRLGIEDVTPIDVFLHRQVAFSFACFGFALIGIPLGVRAHRRETSVGIAVAIALVLVYYLFLIVAQAFQTRSEMAPWMIAWMPNALFQLVGAWLLWRVNRGR